MADDLDNQRTTPGPDGGSGPAPDLSLGQRPTHGDTAGQGLGRVDRYELVERLGTGGFGTVYRARDTVAGIEVAIKALPPQVTHAAEELDRVRANFALVCKLHHPGLANILHLHQAEAVDPRAAASLGIAPGHFLVVMEYVRGTTLSSWRRQFPGGRVPVPEAIRVCADVAAVLDYAHSQGIIHRDVKPANVMITGESATKVLDFGLAAEVRSSLARISMQAGDTSGTRPYMAPEQWAGRTQGPATDQYALAVLFHELVTGAVPFASAMETGDMGLMQQVAATQVPEPVPELTRSQNAALRRALAKKPAARFPSCTSFVAALSGASARGLGTKVAWGLAAAAAVLVIGLAVFALLRSRGGPDTPPTPGGPTPGPGPQVVETPAPAPGLTGAGTPPAPTPTTPPAPAPTGPPTPTPGQAQPAPGAAEREAQAEKDRLAAEVARAVARQAATTAADKYHKAFDDQVLAAWRAANPAGPAQLAAAELETFVATYGGEAWKQLSEQTAEARRLTDSADGGTAAADAWTKATVALPALGQALHLAALLAAAKDAQKTADWGRVRGSADAALRLQPGLAVAEALRREALRNLPTRLLVQVVCGGQPLAGVELYVDGRPVAGADGTPIDVAKGPHTIRVFAPPRGDVVYGPAEREWTADEGGEQTVTIEVAILGRGRDGIIALLRAGRFGDAAALIDDRTDAPWRKAVAALGDLAEAVREVTTADEVTAVLAAQVHTAILQVAQHGCLWYDSQAPWLEPSQGACELTARTLRVWLDKGPACDPRQFVGLVNDWRLLMRVLRKNADADALALAKQRYRQDAAQVRAAALPAWLKPASEFVDAATGRPAEAVLALPGKEWADARLVYVPDGECVIGQTGGEEAASTRALLTGFYIAKYEVTNEQYLAYCDADQPRIPWPPHLTRSGPLTEPKQPVVQVPHQQAVQFCRWLEQELQPGGAKAAVRLPTECQFEKAARGPSLFRYAWGYTFDAAACYNGRTSPGQPQPVGKGTADLSFWGVADLAGNVSEWCVDSWSDQPTQALLKGASDPVVERSGEPLRVVKGGNYTVTDEAGLRVSSRTALAPGKAEATTGFRFVLRLPEP